MFSSYYILLPVHLNNNTSKYDLLPVIGQVAKSGCPISGVTSIQSQSVTQSTVTILSSPTPGMPGVLPGNVLSVQHQKTVSVTTPSMSGSATMATPIVGTSACVNGASVQQVSREVVYDQYYTLYDIELGSL